jgi:predicted nucleic acid-binding protein
VKSARFTPVAGDIREMNCMNAVDTNVLVYYVDVDEPAKRLKAVELLELLERLGREQVETLLLWQVAAEFLNCLRRWENEGRTSRQDTLEYLSAVEPMFRCVLPAQGILRKSLDLSSRFSLSHWDSMIIAACIDAGVRTLYSEDLAHNAEYDSLSVINPFVDRT